MARTSRRRGLILAAGLAVLIPSLGHAQTPATAGYLDHSELTRALRALTDRHRDRSELRSIARSDGGRDIWLLTLGRRQGRALDQRPALLVVANLEGNQLAGSAAALHTAEHLLAGYGTDAEITRLLDERTIYIIPRANPDGAELAFAMPGYEIPYKPHASAPGDGGLNVRERGRDLNGDGLVTLMRVRDPEGEWIADPAEPRLLRRADRTKAERGEYKVYVEGIDPDDAEAYVAAGSDGVNLNRNFQHEYLYYQPHTGPHMVSEIETRALVDFVFDHHNIAAVLTYSPYDNLRTPPPAQRTVPPGVQSNPPTVPTNILAPDRPYFEYVSTRFQELTELKGEGAENEAGSFMQFVYYQAGLPSFTTPVWTLPPAAAAGGGGGAAGGAARGSAANAELERDRRWLSYFAETGIDGFVDWTPARHPTLGDVEVGGFRPNARVNPPAAQLHELGAKHAAFTTWLGGQLPSVEAVATTIEARGDNVWLVTATLANESYLPTQLSMGTRARFNRPISVRLLPAPNVTVLTGDPQQQTPRLEGMGGRSQHRWLVQAPAGTRVTMEVFAERAGGLQSIPLTLR